MTTSLPRFGVGVSRRGSSFTRPVTRGAGAGGSGGVSRGIISVPNQRRWNWHEAERGLDEANDLPEFDGIGGHPNQNQRLSRNEGVGKDQKRDIRYHLDEREKHNHTEQSDQDRSEGAPEPAQEQKHEETEGKGAITQQNQAKTLEKTREAETQHQRVKVDVRKYSIPRHLPGEPGDEE